MVVRLSVIRGLNQILILIFKIDAYICITDMEAERNALMEHVYPRLKHFCRERYGLEFQVSTIFTTGLHERKVSWEVY